MCSILTPRFLSTRVVFHCFLNGIMDVLFMNTINIIMARSTGLFPLINMLQIQDVFQAFGSVVTNGSEGVG